MLMATLIAEDPPIKAVLRRIWLYASDRPSREADFGGVAVGAIAVIDEFVVKGEFARRILSEALVVSQHLSYQAPGWG